MFALGVLGSGAAAEGPGRSSGFSAGAAQDQEALPPTQSHCQRCQRESC